MRLSISGPRCGFSAPKVEDSFPLVKKGDLGKVEVG